MDAPNVRGARDLGFAGGRARGGRPTSSTLQAAGRGRRTSACSTCSIRARTDSIGDTDWILAARAAGKIKTLIVQGALLTPLAEAADIVLAGSAWVEKDATYTNMTGHVQASSRAITPPGDAGEDWQILQKLSVVFGSPVAYASAGDVRAAIARGARPPCRATTHWRRSRFSRPVSARHWLQASNPSERWKWDFMFQDLPPIKFGEDFGPLPRAEVIPLKEVK